MNQFYTNVYQRGNALYVRGVENGRRFNRKVDFRPTLWVQGRLKDAADKWQTIDGQTVYAVQPGSIYDCKAFTEQYKDVHGFQIYESPGHVYQYIAHMYPGELRLDTSDVVVYTTDIETETEYGFPDPALAQEVVQLITIIDAHHNKVITWGLREVVTKPDRVEYRHFSNERSLLMDFIVWWQQNYPDVITGWNSSLFDITYLYNRLCRVLGDTLANKISPWGQVSQRDVDLGGRTAQKTFIAGIASLDYLDLYKKFGTYSAKESYKLDAIAGEELGVGKLPLPGDGSFKSTYTGVFDIHAEPEEGDHPINRKAYRRTQIKQEMVRQGIREYDTGSDQLSTMYRALDLEIKQECWDNFVAYNVRDVELVYKLDDKMKLMDLALTLAYAAKVNYEDVFGPVKTWDIIIYNYLNDMKVVVPPRKNGHKDGHYEGAYVKDPLIGKHHWCCSFDLNSLYPHLIMQYNMSPETITDLRIQTSVDKLLNKEIDLQEAYDNDYAVAANGWCFRKDKRGLLPTQMQLYYDKRVIYKKEMLKAKQEYANTKDPKWTKEISRLNNLQMAMKILLNSAYGAMGNAYFRYFDTRIAEGITISGQLSIRWIANKLNGYFDKIIGESKDRVVLIDTDSVVLTLNDLVQKVYGVNGKVNLPPEKVIQFMDRVAEDKIQPFLDESYQELADYMNAYEQKMQMKRENLVDVMISVSKKRYVMSVHNSEGVQYKEPQLKIMGLQMVKSSTPAVIRDKLKDSLHTILHSQESDVQQYVADFRKQFDQFTPGQIAFPRSISDVRKFENATTIYNKGTPIHVRGALLYNHYLKKMGLTNKYPLIREGDKIKFLYIKTPNPMRENCISFIDTLPEEFNLTEYVDYSKMYEKTFQDAVQNILDSLGWSAEQRATLEDWFV